MTIHGAEDCEIEIWVDADACPGMIKKLLYRFAQRTKTRITFVANQVFMIPRSPYVKFLLVGSGFDIADNRILQCMKGNDLVITGDIPLAAQVIDRGGIALNPRGTLYTKENITSRLYVRDLMDTLRSGGMETQGPAPMGPKDCQRFSNCLNKLMASCYC